MKIAIHHQNQGNFSERWIAYCDKKGISYKIVNCYDNNIFDQLNDCDALMWHFHHSANGDYLFAKQLLFAVQLGGRKVFPDFNTVWHFDDKLGQKYLFESIGAPLVPSYVFYSKEKAIDWTNMSSFPKVFKLRNGAGSWNVKLVRTKEEAIKLIDIAFSEGFSHQVSAKDYFKETWRKYKLGKKNISHVRGALKRFVYVPKSNRKIGRENGYIYFQDFIPNNNFDIRVIVASEKAFAIKRMVRENDFRASGSGNILYKKENFDNDTIRLAFELANKTNSQCAAFDFVFKDNKPLVVEISFGFVANVYDKCEGYWDKNLLWHKGSFNPYGWMVEDLISSIKRQ